MAMFPCSLKPLGGPLYLTYTIDSLHHRLLKLNFENQSEQFR